MKRTLKATAAALLLTTAGHALGQLQHGVVRVTEINGGNTAASVALSRAPGGFGAWTITGSTSSRADYALNFGTANDTTSGIILTSPMQTQRTEPSVDHEYFATTGMTTGSGRWFASVFEAPTGDEVNFNVAVAYFPNADGWIAGRATNTTAGGPLTAIAGNPNIHLRDENTATGAGIELVDNTTTDGEYLLRAPGIDFRRQGVLLACGGENTGNHVGVRLNDDGTATLHCMSNDSEGPGVNESVAFAFIPAGAHRVTMATISGSGRPLFRQGNFNVSIEPGAVGTYRLSIPGESPASGTLMVTPCTELNDSTVDNIVLARPEGNNWIITVRDTEALPGGMALELQTFDSLVFSFAFFENVTINPATPPSLAPRLNDVVAARFHVTEFSSGNGLGESRADRTAGSDALDVFGDNRGDYAVCWLGARSPAARDGTLDAAEGVLLGSCSELIRDNNATGSDVGWTDLSNDDNIIRLHRPSQDDEFNSDFGAVFFPNAAGFIQATQVAAPNGHASILIPNAASGVLIAINWANDNRVVAASRLLNNFNITVYEGPTGDVATDNPRFGYVYLPYTTRNLVAGRVSSSGSILGGSGYTTSTGTYASVTGTFNITNITISGVDARTDGVLLLTGAGHQAMSWTPGPNGEFIVAGRILDTEIRARYEFMFAYVPYEGLRRCAGDFNDDGSLNSQDFFDFLTAFFALAPSADFNQNGTINSQDYFDFITAFFAGCA